MTVRTWVYQRLTQFEPLTDLIGGDLDPRVFAKKSMTSSHEDHPYIVYKLGYNANEDISEEVDISRQFFQVWAHDYTDGETGDYLKIDAVIKQIKAAFKNQQSPSDGVIAVRFLEISQDLNDETLNTLFKYVRFQLIMKE